MAKQNASGRTINTNLSALSSLFKHLCEHQAATNNPVTGIQRSKVNNDRVQTPLITPQQVRKMLDAPDSPAVKPQSLLKKLRDKTLLSTLLYSGCREAELYSLKVKDFYEDAGYWVLDFTVKGGKKIKLPFIRN